jgi:hypothetical protein
MAPALERDRVDIFHLHNAITEGCVSRAGFAFSTVAVLHRGVEVVHTGTSV